LGPRKRDDAFANVLSTASKGERLRSSLETLELYRKRTGATVSVSLDLRSSLSIQPFEGSRFVRGGRYGISIDFGLEVIEKESVCGSTFESRFIKLTHEAQDCLIVTRDRLFCKTPSLESPMPGGAFNGWFKLREKSGQKTLG
jgi:hypothetical protein